MKYQVNHPFKPIYDENSKILILGTIPSVKSRENNFYYGHPQNRFWKTIAGIFGTNLPEDNKKKIELLKNNGIALTDVLQSCLIEGSSDAAIKNGIPRNLDMIMKKSKINAIFCNGSKAHELYMKHNRDKYNLQVFCLPSTSPANAKYRLHALIEQWKIIKNYTLRPEDDGLRKLP